MVEETDQIKKHIENEREILSRNLDEIEYRFKDATSLKARFDRNPGWFLGAAVAGGFLLSLAVKRSSQSGGTNLRSAYVDRDTTKPARLSFATPHLNRLSDTVDNIVAGLVGVFSDRLQSFVADAVPGFREQYDSSRQRERSSEQVTRSNFGR